MIVPQFTVPTRRLKNGQGHVVHKYTRKPLFVISQDGKTGALTEEGKKYFKAGGK